MLFRTIAFANSGVGCATRTVGAPYFSSLKATQHQAGAEGPAETEGSPLEALPLENDHDDTGRFRFGDGVRIDVECLPTRRQALPTASKTS
jgi:hypothetical protein